MTGPRNSGTPRRLRQSEQPKARRPQALHKALLLKRANPVPVARNPRRPAWLEDPAPKKAAKPRQPTIITMATAAALNWLENHGLADFSTSQLVVDGTGGMPRYGV